MSEHTPSDTALDTAGEIRVWLQRNDWHDTPVAEIIDRETAAERDRLRTINATLVNALERIEPSLGRGYAPDGRETLGEIARTALEQAGTHDDANLRKIVVDLLAYETEAAKLRGLHDCTCALHSRETDVAYERGECVHQRARNALAQTEEPET